LLSLREKIVAGKLNQLVSFANALNFAEQKPFTVDGAEFSNIKTIFR
jgi:hypothetical protein